MSKEAGFFYDNEAIGRCNEFSEKYNNSIMKNSVNPVRSAKYNLRLFYP